MATVYVTTQLTGTYLGRGNDVYFDYDGVQDQIIYAGDNSSRATTNLNLRVGTYTTPTSSIYGVFGGGNNATGVITETTSVKVERGVTVSTLFGGGNSAAVANTSLTIRGTVTTLFGGGRNGAVGIADATIDTNGTTSVVLEGGIVTTLYAGGRVGTVGTQADPTGSTSVVLRSYTDGETTTCATVNYLYGGGYSGTVYGNTSVKLESDTSVINALYGGGSSGIVTGSTSIVIEGATAERAVYGGGQNATATVGTAAAPTGSTYVELKDYVDSEDNVHSGIVKQALCGGGQLGDVYGDTHVAIKSGTANQNIFGGGYFSVSSKACGLVHGDTNVEVSGGKVNWNVYGGGYGGTVDGTATISITGGEFSATSRVYGGSCVKLDGGTIHDYNQASDVTLDADDVTVQRLAGGAEVSVAETFALSGDTKVTLAAGTVSQAVVGRANAFGGATVTDGGANTVTTIDITGGEAHVVAGAGLVTAASTTYAYEGNTVINVSGGAIDYLFGGNVGSMKTYCGNTKMDGDVAITVDTSTETVTLKYLYAGSNSSTGYEAQQAGNTLVTFTGLGSNLIWAEGGISGDGSGKLGDINKKQYTRTLLFDDFTGAFDAPVISRFDVIAFEDSDVTFSAASLRLSGVCSWEFELGSSLTLTGSDSLNNFAGDALIFGGADDAITTDWEVITSKNNKAFAGWDQADILLFGTALDTYDDDTGTWSAEGFGYVARWDDEDHKIIIAQA